jgi:hypothetical protein
MIHLSSIPVAGDNLRINGSCTFDNAASNLAYGSLQIGSSIAGTLDWPAGGTNTLNVTAISSLVSGSVLDMTNGGTLQIRTSWATANQTFTPGTGTINWNITGAASTLPAAITTYNNLTITVTGRVANLAIATTVNNNLLISAGTLDVTTSNLALNIKGNFTNNATFTPRSGTVTLNGTGPQNISGTRTPTGFSTLTINKSSGTATLGVNITTTTNLTVTAGILDLSTRTAARASPGGTLTVANGATLKIGGTNTLPANYTAHTFGASSTIEYSGTAQTVASENYTGNLVLSGSGAKTIATGTGVSGNLTISGSATASINAGLNINVGTLTLGGIDVVSGSWGSTTAIGATNHNNTYFAATTGYVTASSQIAPTQLVYTTVPTTGIAGTAFTVIVQSQAANGYPASPTSNTTITLSKASGGGTLSGTLTGTITASSNSVTISTAVYSKADTMTLTATATAGMTSLTPITSGNMVFSAGTATRLVITGSSTQTAGGSQELRITAEDSGGNTTATYTGTKNLTFSGANSSTDPAITPTVTNSSGTPIAFGSITSISFIGGVATVSGGSNGVMTLYKVETATISVTDGSLSSSGIDQLTVVVNQPLTLNSIGLYLIDHTSTNMAMTPQVEYAVKATITDLNSLNDLTTVVVTIYYDASGTYNPANIPTSGNTQTAAILTCTVGTSPTWSISPNASTSWSIVSANCVQPTLTGNTGDFWFHFKPGKVTTAATGNWYIYARATNKAAFNGDNHQNSLTMNWYGEVSISTIDITWGTVDPGSDFITNIQTGITIKYICNGDFQKQVMTTSPWLDGNETVRLNTGGNPGNNEFSLKANSTDIFDGAQLVNNTGSTTIGTGTQTGESGVTVSTNTIWLRVGTGIFPDQYNGTIYFGIAP